MLFHQKIAPVEEIEKNCCVPVDWGKAKKQQGWLSVPRAELFSYNGGNVPNNFNALLKVSGCRAFKNIPGPDVFGKPAIVTRTRKITSFCVFGFGLVDHIKEPKRWNCGKSFFRRRE